MKMISIRVDDETAEALDFLIKQESNYVLRDVTVSEYIRSLITKESLRFAFKTTKKQLNNSDN